jgi:DNA-binding NarL/FixJ family response regulator
LDTRAEGNAFFTIQLLRALEETDLLHPNDDDGWTVGGLDRAHVPPALRQVIDGRLARLDEESQRLLAVAAVIGQEIPLALWAAVGESDEGALLGLVERAAHVLEETPDGMAVRFEHALVREAVYAGISPARRRLLHRRIAELLATPPQPDPDAVAMHFQRSADARAVPWLVKAGERAQLAYAIGTAIERYEAALALPEGSEGDLAERGWLRYRLGRLYRWTAPQQGVEYLDEALRIATIVGDRALAAAARFSRGRCLFYEIDYEAGLREMAAGCDALEALPPEEQERLDLGPDADGLPTITIPRGQHIIALAECGRIAEAMAMGEATREGMPRYTVLGELGWAHYGDRYEGLGIAYALAGRPTEAHEAFAYGRERNRAVGDIGTPGTSMWDELNYVSLIYVTDRVEEHWRLAEGTAAVFGQVVDRMGTEVMSFTSIPVLALTGRWREAHQEAESAMRAGLLLRWRDVVAPILGELARAQGEWEEAWRYLALLLPLGAQTVPGRSTLLAGFRLLRLGAGLLLDAGNLPEAHTWLLAHDHWLTWSGAVLGQSEGQMLWAQHFRQAGDREKAHEHAERALAHATEPRQPLALIAAHRLLSQLDTETGRFAEASEHLDAALTLADACHAPYERALTLLAMADLRAAMGETTEARTLLDEVRTICIPLDAQPALARADALAARLAASPSTAPTYPAGLSVREIEVLRLLTAGQSNREIADSLFLSEHTVRAHVRNIFTKIGADNRTEAALFARDHGLA